MGGDSPRAFEFASEDERVEDELDRLAAGMHLPGSHDEPGARDRIDIDAESDVQPSSPPPVVSFDEDDAGVEDVPLSIASSEDEQEHRSRRGQSIDHPMSRLRQTLASMDLPTINLPWFKRKAKAAGEAGAPESGTVIPDESPTAAPQDKAGRKRKKKKQIEPDDGDGADPAGSKVAGIGGKLGLALMILVLLMAFGSTIANYLHSKRVVATRTPAHADVAQERPAEKTPEKKAQSYEAHAKTLGVAGQGNGGLSQPGPGSAAMAALPNKPLMSNAPFLDDAGVQKQSSESTSGTGANGFSIPDGGKVAEGAICQGGSCSSVEKSSVTTMHATGPGNGMATAPTSGRPASPSAESVDIVGAVPKLAPRKKAQDDLLLSAESETTKNSRASLASSRKAATAAEDSVKVARETQQSVAALEDQVSALKQSLAKLTSSMNAVVTQRQEAQSEETTKLKVAYYLPDVKLIDIIDQDGNFEARIKIPGQAPRYVTDGSKIRAWIVNRVSADSIYLVFGHYSRIVGLKADAGADVSSEDPNSVDQTDLPTVSKNRPAMVHFGENISDSQ